MGKHRPAVVAPVPIARRRPLRKSALIGMAAAGCLLTAAAGTYTAANKDVALVVDGRTEQVRTTGSTVGGVLHTAGVTVGPDDSLSPAESARISDGSTIVLRHKGVGPGGPDSDAAEVAAPAVAGLAEGGDLPPVALPPGSPGAPVRTRTVALVVAGRLAATGSTASGTVAALLSAEHIPLGPLDRVSPAPDTPLSDGLRVTVQRGQIVASSQLETITAPADISVGNGDLDRGTSKRVRAGTPGSARVTVDTTLLDGVPVARLETGRTVLSAPRAGLVQVGTRTPDPAGPSAADAAARRFTYRGIQVLTHDTTFGVNWDGLSMCESTHYPRAINANPSAGLPTYGLFQFDLPTWADVGGTGNPIDASPKEQLMRAKMLWQRRGLEPWACRDAAH